MSKKKDHKEDDHLNEKTDEAAGNETSQVENSNNDKEVKTEEKPSEKEDSEKNSPVIETSPEEIISKAKEELKNANDRYLRLMAEFDNYKKRTTRDYQRMVETANEKLMNDMIGVRNTFELALKHGETSSDYQKLFDGVKLIFNKFDGVLNSHGLSSFAEKGEPFDPQIHEALMKMPHEEIGEDNIVEIFEKGYRLFDRVIRHAKVIVSSGKPAAVEESSAQNGEE